MTRTRADAHETSAAPTGPVTKKPSAGMHEVDRALAAHYDRLSAGQRRAIDRLLQDSRYGAVVSAPELSRSAGISESTITRAAQALGFTGFPDLQRHLRASFVEPVGHRLESIGQDDEAAQVLAVKVMHEDAVAIRDMADDLALPAFRAVVETLIGARRVLLFGERGSHGLVLMLGIGLRLVLPNVHLLSQVAGDLPDQLIGLGPGDAVVAVSSRRVDRMTVRVLKRAQAVGAVTIALTDHRSSPAARASDLTLITGIGTLRLMPSFAPGASLVNALLAEVASRTHREAAIRLEDAEALWEQFDSYAER